jgi:hypothetical protein
MIVESGRTRWKVVKLEQQLPSAGRRSPHAQGLVGVLFDGSQESVGCRGWSHSICCTVCVCVVDDIRRQQLLMGRSEVGALSLSGGSFQDCACLSLAMGYKLQLQDLAYIVYDKNKLP